jgi:hypothetical protein
VKQWESYTSNIDDNKSIAQEEALQKGSRTSPPKRQKSTPRKASSSAIAVYKRWEKHQRQSNKLGSYLQFILLPLT